MNKFNDFDDFVTAITTLENVVLFFTASWCEPCKVMYPIVENLASNLSMCHFFKIDVDVEETEQIVEHFDVSSMPTFFFIKNNDIKNTLIGVNKEQFSEYLKVLLNNAPEKKYENNLEVTENNLEVTEKQSDFNVLDNKSK